MVGSTLKSRIKPTTFFIYTVSQGTGIHPGLGKGLSSLAGAVSASPFFLHNVSLVSSGPGPEHTADFDDSTPVDTQQAQSSDFWTVGVGLPNGEPYPERPQEAHVWSDRPHHCLLS